MDSSPPNQQSQPARAPILPERNRGMFVFWIVTATIVTIFSLTILNYFNILKLSEIFPNYLGFLPQSSYELPQKEETPRVRQSFPTPIISSPSEEAKQTLIDYISTFLNSSLLATSSSEIIYSKEEGAESYTAFWNTKDDGMLKVAFSPSSSGKQIASFNLAFYKSHSGHLSKDIAQTIASANFLINPKGEWKCINISERVYCENFWEEKNGVRRGIAVVGHNPLSLLKKSTVYLCEHSKESSSYSWKSCTEKFAETGAR